MKKRILTFLMAFILVLSIICIPGSNQEVKAATGGTQEIDLAWKVLEIVNKERVANGLGTVVMDQKLVDTAQLRATEIVDLFSHTRPNGERCFSAFPASNGMMGENIAAGQDSAEEVMEAWMNSPGHRANILRPEFNALGVGCYYMPNNLYGLHWVQCFDSEIHEEAIDPHHVKEVRTDDGTIPMYRLYNPNSGEHFYTKSFPEATQLTSVGWRYEGIAWYAPSSGAPVYRLYNANAGDHHYTLNEAEKNMLVSAGWSYEGVSWYSGGNVKMYRAYNPNAKSGSHHYTTNSYEIANICASGWKDEGFAWYGVR